MGLGASEYGPVAWLARGACYQRAMQRHGGFSLGLGMVVAAWMVAACAAKSDAGGGEEGVLTSAQFCARHASQSCSYYAECGCWSSQQACVDNLTGKCEDFAARDARRGRHLDATRAQECLDELASAVADCAFVDATHAVGYQYCDAFRGSAAQGEPCLEPADCVQPQGTVVTCILDQPDGSGLCNQLPLAKRGAACDPAGFDGPFCAEGLWCDPESSHCTKARALGEPCISKHPQGETSCTAGLYCSPSTATCTEPSRAGETCDGYFIRSTCEPGYDCQNEEGICQPSLVSEHGDCE